MSRRRNGITLTRQIVAHIKHLLATTNWNYAQIAAAVGGVNRGRISEIKTGKRFADVCASEFKGGV